jgi:hypothetical protein
MSTNGDLEMADANAGADINNAEVELVEPQRIRVVSFLFILFSHMTSIFFAYYRANCKTALRQAQNKYSRANLMRNSYLDQLILLLHSNSPRKTTLLETLCDTSS